MQNIPIKNARGRRIREAFVAGVGKEFISADYSQIELRVLAHLSGDENLQKAFNEGEDIHQATAKDIFGEVDPSSGEYSENRRYAKTINFGIVYGMSAFRLAGELGISRGQAQQYIDEYFARYPKVKQYFETLDEKIENDGYVETLFGRRRYLDQIDASGRDQGYLRRSLINAPIQGTAAELIKIAMIKLDEELKAFNDKASLVLQVHDELLIEVSSDVADSVSDIVVSTMESAVELAVLPKVEFKRGRSWGEMQ